MRKEVTFRVIIIGHGKLMQDCKFLALVHWNTKIERKQTNIKGSC